MAWLGAVVAAAAALSSCSAGSDGVVASVGGRRITASMLDHWARVLTAGRRGATSEGASRRRALRFLISADWLVGEAADRGMAVSAEQAEQSLMSGFPGGSGEALAYARAAGESLADARVQAGAELAAMRLRGLAQSGSPTVPPAQVAAFYARHRQLYAQPERRVVTLSMRRRKPTAAELRRMSRARRKLITPKIERAHEAYITVEAPPGSRSEVERAIFAARPGVLVVVPPEPGGDYGVFVLWRILPARQLPLAQVAGQIRRRLAEEARRRAASALLEGWATKWTARTSCRPAYVVEQCRQYEGRGARREPLELLR